MTNKNQFDHAAKEYDNVFTNSCVGLAQRDQVWAEINKLEIESGVSVLELNCGTGVDAERWNANGFNVLATDISQEMIDQCRLKHDTISYKQLDINTSKVEMKDKAVIFSNFGGFNCLTKTEIELFFENASQQLVENGQVILVIMGKKCIWDNIYQIFKRNWNQIGRRNTDKVLNVHVEGRQIPTYFYSPKDIVKMAGNRFKSLKIKPIGLFIPPSYLAGFFEKKPILFSLLKTCDKITRFSFLANYSDHFIVTFRQSK